MEQQTGMKQRDAAYDNLKFLLIVLVAVIHGADFFRETVPAFRSIYIFIYPFVMPAFVFVSGLFAKNARTDGQRAMRRAGYFVVLYILCKILLTIPSMLLSGTKFDLFCESGIPWFMLGMAWWYVFTFLLRGIPAGAAFGAALFLGCVSGYISGIGDFLCLSKTIVFYPFFLAGCYLDPRKILQKTRGFLPKAAGAAGFLILFYLAAFRLDAFYELRPLFSARDSFYALPLPAYGALYRLFYYLAVSVLICGLIAWIPRRTLPVSLWGQRTLQVYFFHYIVIYPLKFLPAAKLPEALCAAVVAAACVAAVCVLSLKWFSYPFAWLQKLLLKKT